MKNGEGRDGPSQVKAVDHCSVTRLSAKRKAPGLEAVQGGAEISWNRSPGGGAILEGRANNRAKNLQFRLLRQARTSSTEHAKETSSFFEFGKNVCRPRELAVNGEAKK